MIHDRFPRGLSLSLLFAFLMLLPSSSFGQRAARRDPSYLWSGDYRESLATAQRENKPIMLVFRCVP